MQAAIDSAKRRFDINITDEIHRIKKDIDVNKNGYPVFWLAIRKGFNKNLINRELQCPMNLVYDLKIKSHHPTTSTIPMKEYLVYHKLTEGKAAARKIQALIEKYSIDLNNYNSSENDDTYLLLENNFDELIDDIRQLTISKKYAAIVTWLISRAFLLTSQKTMKSNLNKNRPLLLKALYTANPSVFIDCFRTPEKILM